MLLTCLLLTEFACLLPRLFFPLSSAVVYKSVVLTSLKYESDVLKCGGQAAASQGYLLL